MLSLDQNKCFRTLCSIKTKEEQKCRNDNGVGFETGKKPFAIQTLRNFKIFIPYFSYLNLKNPNPLTYISMC